MDTDLPPPALDRPQIACAIAAAIHYEVPANALLAVAEQERGRPNQWVTNANGTHDVGVMQFNTTYLKQLERFGITPEHAASRDCYPYTLAAWRIKNHLVRDGGPFWNRVANYHSRTPQHNQHYAGVVAEKGRRWALWLEQNYLTRTLDAAAASQLPGRRGAPDPTARTIDSPTPRPTAQKERP